MLQICQPWLDTSVKSLYVLFVCLSSCWVLNLEPPDDFPQKHLPTKRLIHYAEWTCQKIQSEICGTHKSNATISFFCV